MATSARSTTSFTRILSLLAVTVALLATAVLTSRPAAADASNDVIRDLDVTFDIEESGAVHVTETYTWDFGSRAGLGFTRYLDTRFDYPEFGYDRVYEYSDFETSSPSGAPADRWVDDQGSQVRIDVGAPDGSSDTRSGQQTYVLTYTITGAQNAIRDDDRVTDRDEFYWNVTGQDWEIPIESISVTVNGPASLIESDCLAGGGGTDGQCSSHSESGSTVQGSHGRLSPGDGLTIVAAYEPGTFTDTEPILQRSAWLAAWWVPVPIIGSLIFAIVFAVRGRRSKRDLAFAGVAPGVIPADPENAPVQQLTHEPEIAVQFQPPPGVEPGQILMLRGKSSPGPTALTASMVGLAVRGIIQIQEHDYDWRNRPKDWVFTQLRAPEPGELQGFDLFLIRSLFISGHSVRFSDLQKTFHTTLKNYSAGLQSSVKPLNWFIGPLGGKPNRLSALALLGLFGGGGALLWTSVGNPPWNLGPILIGVAVCCLILGIGGIVATRTQRSALGRALYDQSRGFETYISTAEANQLRFEEGEDIFSRYLPYAIVFGQAERWSGLFAQLAQQGQYTAHTTWYIGHSSTPGAPPNFSALGSALNSFSTATSTAGSSGGSGSGGGGSVGGGGGGGGGGGR